MMPNTVLSLPLISIIEVVIIISWLELKAHSLLSALTVQSEFKNKVKIRSSNNVRDYRRAAPDKSDMTGTTPKQIFSYIFIPLCKYLFMILDLKRKLYLKCVKDSSDNLIISN